MAINYAEQAFDFRTGVLDKALNMTDRMSEAQDESDRLNDEITELRIPIDAQEAKHALDIATEVVKGDKSDKAKFGNSDARDAELKRRLSGDKEHQARVIILNEKLSRLRASNRKIEHLRNRLVTYQAFLKGSI